MISKVIGNCIVERVVFQDLNALLDKGPIFPDVHIQFKGIFTLELLLKGLFLFISSIIDDVEGKVVKFHPLAKVVFLEISVHMRSYMHQFFHPFNLELANVKFRNLVKMIAAKSL